MLVVADNLTDKLCRSAETPKEGSRIVWDSGVRGLGLRVTTAGTKAFVLNYRTAAGVERRHTIGRYPEISLQAARKRASALKDQIKHDGADPVGKREAERDAPTVADLCARFLEEHAAKKRPGTQAEYRAAVAAILAEWRNRKVDDIRFADVEALHRKISRFGTRGIRPAPYQANRVVAACSKMFRLAKRWGWVKDLPTEGVERNQEIKRERFLAPDELRALLRALAEHPGTGRKEDRPRRQTATDIVRLLLLTGARRGEVCTMRWRDVDLRAGRWTKPAASTKQKRTHRAPINAPALLLLSEIRSRRKHPAEDDPIFPSPGGNGPQADLKKSWEAIRRRATVILYAGAPKSREMALVQQLRKTLRRDPTLAEVDAAARSAKISLPAGLRDLRMHDLRHSYASFLVSEGMSLPTIGALLGHTQPQTTARYSHLFDDPLRRATERVGEIIAGADAGGAEIVPLTRRRR